jgi:hypothetical protein
MIDFLSNVLTFVLFTVPITAAVFIVGFMFLTATVEAVKARAMFLALGCFFLFALGLYHVFSA